MSKLTDICKEFLRIKSGEKKLITHVTETDVGQVKITIPEKNYQGNFTDEQFVCSCGEKAFAICENCGEPYCEDCDGSGVSSTKCIDYNCCDYCAEKIKEGHAYEFSKTKNPILKPAESKTEMLKTAQKQKENSSNKCKTCGSIFVGFSCNICGTKKECHKCGNPSIGICAECGKPFCKEHDGSKLKTSFKIRHKEFCSDCLF